MSATKPPTYARYARVSDILESDKAVRNLLGPRTEIVCRPPPSNEKVKFARPVTYITEEYHLNGMDVHSVSKNDILQRAFRLIVDGNGSFDLPETSAQAEPEPEPAKAAPKTKAPVVAPVAPVAAVKSSAPVKVRVVAQPVKSAPSIEKAAPVKEEPKVVVVKEEPKAVVKPTAPFLSQPMSRVRLPRKSSIVSVVPDTEKTISAEAKTATASKIKDAPKAEAAPKTETTAVAHTDNTPAKKALQTGFPIAFGCGVISLLFSVDTLIAVHDTSSGKAEQQRKIAEVIDYYQAKSIPVGYRTTKTCDIGSLD